MNGMTDHSAPLSRILHGFGTDVAVQLWPRAGGEPAADQALERAVALLHRAERLLSRFDPRSDITRVNRHAGQPVRVSRLTRQAVAVARAAARATGGLFDPTVLPAVAAGYDRDFAQLAGAPASALGPDAGPPVPAAGPRPSPPGPRVREGRPRFHAVEIDARAGTICVPEGSGLDLGGIAKGWLADVTVRRLHRYGAALADLGGDIAVAGLPPGRDAWEIEVADPWGGPGTLGVLRLRPGHAGVATSGVLRRRWLTPTGPQHHIIDPRTGRPARTDLVQVTVVAPRATAAEAAATAVLLLGRATGTEVLALSGCLAGVLVDVDGNVASVGFADTKDWVTWHPTAA